MTKDIRLRIVLQNPAEGTLYGLQKGKAANYETVQAQIGNGQDLIFNFAVQVKEANGATPTLAGPFVQGPAGNRFVYIGIGSYAGQTAAPWSGRIKVPLSETTFLQQPAETHASWSCTVPGSTKDGKPVFATVKPFAGWVREEQGDHPDAL
ncbi:MAG TPA: DUF5990 family protein [Flavisolibacter sp.]|nr:DUF5990 family protein [Flavisolibacter sp.]